ncbi:hypothetical protein [Chryseobacterium sp.]|uniref:hypothetical protein n=1 Tax=Chryseobacterium sp. TaxID=1871047 RepID=UPI0025BFE247|nr:hypothetical protein [Chryseobacterium sp.]MBV8326861.1 hypothetical protein [Chryseobacterium sp.]
MNSELTNNKLSISTLRLFLNNEKSQFKKGEDFLCTLAGTLSDLDDYSFERGITGFGWLVSYLHYHHYIGIDSNKILEDIDDQIYRYTLHIIASSKDETETLLEIFSYALIRHLDRNPHDVHYQKYIHHECITLIVNIFTYYLKTSLSKKNLSLKEFHNCCKILLKLSFCLEYIKKTEWNLAFKKYLINITSFIRQNYDQNSYPYEQLLILLLAAKQRKEDLAETKILELIFSCTSYSGHFILDILKNRSLNTEGLKDHELIFLLTNYNIPFFQNN